MKNKSVRVILSMLLNICIVTVGVFIIYAAGSRAYTFGHNIFDEEAIDTKNAAINILDFLRKNKSEDKFIVVGQNINFDIKFIEEMFLKEWKIKDFRGLVSYRVLDIM